MENIQRLIATLKEEPGIDARLVVAEDNGQWEAEVQWIDKQGTMDWEGFGVDCCPAVEYAGNVMDVLPLLDAQCHTVLVALEQCVVEKAERKAYGNPGP